MVATLIDINSPFLNDLDIENLDAKEKVNINALLEVSTELIQKECNRVFLGGDYTDEPHDGDNLNSIFCKNIPLNSLSTITVLPDISEWNRDFLDEYLFTWLSNLTEPIVYPDANHTIDEIFNTNTRTGEIWFKPLNLITTPPNTYLGYFPFGRQNILISYNGGFDPVPTPIQMLCAELVQAAFAPEEVFGNIDSEKLGQYFYKTKKGVMENQLMANKRIISLYKIRKV